MYQEKGIARFFPERAGKNTVWRVPWETDASGNCSVYTPPEMCGTLLSVRSAHTDSSMTTDFDVKLLTPANIDVLVSLCEDLLDNDKDDREIVDAVTVSGVSWSRPRVVLPSVHRLTITCASATYGVLWFEFEG